MLQAIVPSYGSRIGVPNAGRALEVERGCGSPFVDAEQMASRTVSVRLVRNLLDAAERGGCDAAELLRRSGMAPHDCADVDARIPMATYARLQRHTMRAMDDESLGAMPARQHLGTWAMICRSVIQCGRLGHALSRMFKHYALFEWSLVSRIELDGDDCVIAVSPRPGVSFDYGVRAYEMVFSVTHAFACWLVQEYVPLSSVSFVHQAPEYAEDYQFLFKCADLRFGQHEACLRFPKRLLDLELQQDEQSLEAFLANGCLEMVDAVAPRRSWTHRLRGLIERDLQRLPEFEDVARRVNLHPQTLRRRLAAEGTTYKDLKDDLRRAAATYHLQRGGLSVEDVADKAGFSEASAFIRAFRRWTGQTPHDYRLACRKAALN